MSANVHSLLHLPEVTKDLVPLWATSCFPHEAANGDILKLFHGSKGVVNRYSNNTYVHTSMCTHTLYTSLLGIYLCPI